MTATVLTALAHDWEGRMVAIVDRLPGVGVGRRCADVADLLAAASAGHGDVALVSADLRDLDRDALAHLRDHGVRVIGASREGEETQERHLRQLGVTRHIHLGTPPEDLLEVLTTDGGTSRVPGPGVQVVDPERGDAGEAATTSADESVPAEGSVPAEESEGPARGTVVAVWGPTGAPGRSTLAVNLASEIAASGTPVLLIDLDTHGAAVAQLLGVLDESPGLAAAARASELGTLDLPALARLAVEVSPGFRALTGLPTPSRWTEVRAAAVEQVIGLARSLARVVVLDCGFGIEDDEELSYDTLAPRRNATTLTALAEADDLLLVGAADPVGLQRMVRAVQDVGSLPSPTPRAVVNRLRASSVGPDPRRRVEDALSRFAGLDAVTFLPDDPAATDAALLAGRTLRECAPQSDLRLAIAEVAGLFTAGAPVRHRPARRRFFSRGPRPRAHVSPRTGGA